MAQRFAKLDENNVVIGEILLDDSKCGSSESDAIASLQEMYGWQYWKRTYYGNEGGATNPRKNYGSMGFVYDESADAFKPATAPYASWTRNSTTLLFEAPLTKPSTQTDDPDNPGNPIDDLYEWDEDAYQADNTTGWVKQ